MSGAKRATAKHSLHALTHPEKTNQTGQALALGISIAGVGAIAFVALYNVGQVALARARLTHATDAAAYSAALIQARALNMLAHVQRAQVGHQIAIAHLATLGAWSKFSDTQHRMHRVGNPPGMIIGRLFGYAHKQAFARSGREAAHTQVDLAEAITRHDKLVHEVLARVGNALVEELETTRMSVIQEVLQANLPGLRVGTGNDDASVLFTLRDDRWPTFIKKRPGNAPDGSRPLVEAAASRYGFLDKRHHTVYNLWSIHPACPWMLHALQRRGASWLDAGGRWQAVDTQSFHARRFNRYIGCYYREYTMGWAATRGDAGKVTEKHAPGTAVPPDFSQEAYWRWTRRATRWDLRLAENRVGALRAMMTAWAPSQRGLSETRSIQSRGQRDATFLLDVTQRSKSVATTDAASRIVLRVGQFLFPGLGDGAQVRVRAAAQTYFSPPATKSDRDLALSTFRPYWRARLIPVPSTPAADRTAHSSSARPPRILPVRTARQSGQALLESIIVVTLLCVLVVSTTVIGQGGYRALGAEHVSRWLAFTATGVGALKQARIRMPALAKQAGVERGARLHMLPGGRGPRVDEMRQAWSYVDAGMVVGRAGTRHTAVVRDAGHHGDDRATQVRIGRSLHAWRLAAEPAVRVAHRVNQQASSSDAAWRRPALSTNWLDSWFDLDHLGRRR